jgi:hypothetical protein
LRDNSSATGKTYNTQIVKNKGTFESRDVKEALNFPIIVIGAEHDCAGMAIPKQSTKKLSTHNSIHI